MKLYLDLMGPEPFQICEILDRLNFAGFVENL